MSGHGKDDGCFCSCCDALVAVIRLQMLREVRERMLTAVRASEPWLGNQQFDEQDMSEIFDRMIAEEEAKS